MPEGSRSPTGEAEARDPLPGRRKGISAPPHPAGLLANISSTGGDKLLVGGGRARSTFLFVHTWTHVRSYRCILEKSLRLSAHLIHGGLRTILVESPTFGTGPFIVYMEVHIRVLAHTSMHKCRFM